jgi:transketolase
MPDHSCIENLAEIANRLRRHVIRMTYAAGSGHPGGSLSAAEMMAALYFQELHLDPAHPDWPDRDRFIMSKGHACPVLYAALAERGFFPIPDLLSLRHISSHLQGHPDMSKTPGVDMTSGPLGSGLAAGVGMALGARITGGEYRVYVMVGEGDMQEGCTWEAAMLAGHHKLNHLTVLIDYNRSQVDGKSDDIVSLDPVADKWRACNWAVREIDGHRLGQILGALDWARSVTNAPAAILAHTLKGKGVSFMEDRHEWHGTAPTRDQAIAALAELGEAWGPPLDQIAPTKNSLERIKNPGEESSLLSPKRPVAVAPATRARLRQGHNEPRRAVRNTFGDVLVELGAELPNLVVLDADISTSLKTVAFGQQYPARHVNFGVAEQYMLLGAAGLAAVGLLPLACTYATFASLRACEQIRSFICYGRLNVKVICSHSGLEVGWDGPTHQATEDVAIMRALPNMTVVVPADAVAVGPLLRQALEMDGPVYFRMGRNPVPIIYDADQSFQLGRALILREGRDLTIIAMGVMVALALNAADELAGLGIQARVADMHTIKPLDGAAIWQAAEETGAIVTAEDHNIVGGLGSAVAEYLSEHMPVPLNRVGIPDIFCRSGDPDELFSLYGMAAPDIVTAAQKVLERKSRIGPSNG